MTDLKVTPYGSWKSPITSDLIVAETIGLGEIRLDGEDIYWTEMRPSEGGRYVIVRRTPDGHISDVTPPPFNARTRVHEYGGGAYLVEDGTIYFSNFADQRLYRQPPGSPPVPLTPDEDLRYADGVMDRRRGRIICVREDHRIEGREADTTLARLDLETGETRVLFWSHDFYSSPRLSSDGSRLAWLAWNHPNMPWDGTELWVAEVNADGSLGRTERVAGGDTGEWENGGMEDWERASSLSLSHSPPLPFLSSESIFQPEWSPDGVLYFISDRTGWWNLYRWRNGDIEPLCEMEAEFGRPQWLFGMSTYAFESAHRLICSYSERGAWRLGILDTTTRELEEIASPYTDISGLRAAPGRVVFLGGSPTEPLSVVHFDLVAREFTVLRRSTNLTVDPGYLSIPRAVEFPTENGLTAYGFYYPPQNRDYTAPPDERPPLLVKSHGGPTAATSTVLNLGIRYWTSRGIAVLDVNYGGSTGYGRAYRERLNDQWGIVDVDDCVNGARYLVEQGLVDGHRLAIDGGSAGGYTTLCALTFRDIFKAGASYYGVSDLEALTKDTHKFESRYSDRLVGPYPERRDLYIERSPIHYTDRLSCPVILFQGLEDKIVPPNQAEMMVEALRKKGVPVAYIAFEGEQHGFRRAENIKRSLDAELYFYSKIFDFELADPVEPVPIENL